MANSFISGVGLDALLVTLDPFTDLGFHLLD